MSFAEEPSVETRTNVVQGSLPPEPITVPAAPAVVAVAAVEPSTQRIRTDHVGRFAPDALITGAVGLVLLVMGLIAITRTGLSGPLSEPVVKVLGFSHTETLGLLEIVAGAALLLSAAARSRGGEAFFGTLLGVGGFVAAVQTSSFRHSLAIQSSLASLAVVAGAVVVFAALALPRFARRSTTIVRV